MNTPLSASSANRYRDAIDAQAEAEGRALARAFRPVRFVPPHRESTARLAFFGGHPFIHKNKLKKEETTHE